LVWSLPISMNYSTLLSSNSYIMTRSGTGEALPGCLR
jgi:hypothetical protein